MKHPTSRLLHAYWDRLRGERAAPERSEIEPGEIRHLLADSLILEIEPARSRAVIRLAGTRICALFGRELRGASFSDLWGEAAGAPLAATVAPWRLVETVADDTVGLVVGLHGRTAGGRDADLELLLLPLRHRGRTQARMLGALSSHAAPVWLGLDPVVALEVRSLRMLAAAGPASVGGEDAVDALPGLTGSASDPLPVRRGHLLVHDGGRA